MPKTANPSTLDYSLKTAQDGTVHAEVRGRMEAGSVGPLWKELASRLKKPRGGLVLDVEKVDYMDMSGQALLLHFSRLVQDRNLPVEIRGLRSDFRHIQEQIDCFDCRPRPMQRKLSALEELGRAAVNLGRDTRQFFSFVGEFVSAFAYSLTHPGTVRWRDVLSHMEYVGGRAVFIIALMGFLIGVIIAFQTAITLRAFGAEIFVAKLLGLSMVRELGPLVTSIILAGRSGSPFAAEIGTMKTNEEINALQTMGLSPVRFLVVPRMLAAMLVTPLLCLFFLLFSFIGGALVMLSMDFTLSSYIHQLSTSVGMTDFLGGMVKVFVFSILVAWIGCVRGLQTGSGASAVGRSTTSAVVSAIVLIILADGIFAVVYYILGI
ncbi:MlaE family lipid ABC transporter permease subunit [Desulfonatronospira sp.]|uniref:MlaE family lipid ABC transporter permease subunit n=1 Tax=Desulfonatronospira sp. TaxID=1962951 RepID=UPI0025C3F695|nr:MlaE family lipid ABC transporter permease subunit [Desulfonatronospira sp.]